jgi:hypothetical protein
MSFTRFPAVYRGGAAKCLVPVGFAQPAPKASVSRIISE